MEETLRKTVAAHEARLASLDPLLPTTDPLPPAIDDDVSLAVPGAVGLARRETPDKGSLLAAWGAAVRHRLVARVSGTNAPTAMGALLDRWHDQVSSDLTPGDRESEAGLTWPSRDAEMTRVFLERGLVPATVIAARPAGHTCRAVGDEPAAPSEARIRPLQPGDVHAATDLWLQLVRWDAKFSSTTERPSTARAIRQVLVTHAHQEPRWAWVVEYLGQLIGLLVASPADHAPGWVGPLTCLSPAAYLDCMVVAEQHRSSGVGAALAQQAHTALDAAGVAVTLLHYTALSPVSGPFWHRSGYRPLWTSWHAHPASALRLP